LEDMQAAQQNINNPQTTAPGTGQPAIPGASPQASAPPPDVLYNNALRDYNAGKNDLAAQEFGDYVKFYPTTDLAGNAYYYLADMEYRQGNYQEAARHYDEVLQNFPTGNKAAAAQLKKGFSLIELGQKNEGVSELRRVIQRYPRSSEALQARERLRKLGVSTMGTARQGE
jgi:tol-pal system protein YbgF